MRQPIFRVKSIAQFPISWTWEKVKLNVLNCIIGICGVKYLCKIAHAWGASFTKKLVFLKLSIFFILRNFIFWKKKNHVFWKYGKNKGNVPLYTFLVFPDVSSSLAFKLCAWESGSTISFELQMPWTSLTLF